MDAKTHFAKSHEQWKDMAAECEKAGLDGIAKACSNRAEHYRVMTGAAAEKTIADELNKGRAELQPTRVSVVTPTPPGVTAVPRAGQRQLEKTVDPEFASLVSSSDDRTE